VLKVLVVESDTVSGILTVDRLRADGFVAVIHHTSREVPKRAVEEYADAVLIAASSSLLAFDVLRQLRLDLRTEALPIMMLLDGGEAGVGVRALREGANHYLIKPYDPDELSLTLKRLLSTRSPGHSLLEGNLSAYPYWELLQFLHQGEKSGRLTLACHRKPADLVLRQGQIAESRFGELRGEEAIIAMLRLEEGHFRFVPGQSAPVELPRQETDVATLLMEEAWLRDELRVRQAYLPEQRTELRALLPVVPRLESRVRGLPVEEIFARIRDQRGTTLASLCRTMDLAPQRIELSLLLLLEGGAVKEVEEVTTYQPTTGEIDAGLLLDLAVDGLLRATETAPEETLRLLLLGEQEVWESLVKVFANAPPSAGDGGWSSLAQQLERRGSGSISVRRARGTLSVVVQLLSPAVQPRIDSMLPLCHGVGIWLNGTRDTASVVRIAGRLEDHPKLGRTVLVAAAKGAQRRATTLAGKRSDWRVCPAAPRSLVAVLQLFE